MLDRGLWNQKNGYKPQLDTNKTRESNQIINRLLNQPRVEESHHKTSKTPEHLFEIHEIHQIYQIPRSPTCAKQSYVSACVFPSFHRFYPVFFPTPLPPFPFRTTKATRSLVPKSWEKSAKELWIDMRKMKILPMALKTSACA